MNENELTPKSRDYGFAIGVATGTLVGAGLALWLAPRAASELRQRMTDSTKRLRTKASEQYQRAGAAVEELTRKGQGVRDGVVEAVAHGAHEVERFALAAKSDRRGM